MWEPVITRSEGLSLTIAYFAEELGYPNPDVSKTKTADRPASAPQRSTKSNERSPIGR